MITIRGVYHNSLDHYNIILNYINNLVKYLIEQLIYHFVVYINTKKYTFKCKTCYVKLHYYNNLLLQFTYISIIKDKLTYKQNSNKSTMK